MLKKRLKNKINTSQKCKAKYFILAVIFGIIFIGCDIAVTTFQVALSIQKFGVIFKDAIIIPHWSLWLLLGNIFIIPCEYCFSKIE